jgi:PrtD family type I secretion system ABC transporter
VTTIFLDLPWAPLFLIPIFIASFWLGLVALLGAAGLVALALFNRRYTQPHFDAANRSAHGSYALAENVLRNSEVVYAMGMERAVGRLWTDARRDAVNQQQLAIARSSWFASAIKFVRIFMQILIMALAALMVLAGAIGPGVMFAASLLFQRAISPVERLVGSWRTIVESRLAFSRLNETLLSAPPPPPPTQLPRLVGAVDFENVSYASPVTGRPILRGIKLSVSPGETVGIIGPSGAGKSTFLKMVCGVLTPSLGTVRIDGADLKTWDRAHFGQFVGYLPQDVELFSGTVAENVSRFERDADPTALFEAAKLAGVHELILGLPYGYDTQLGDGGGMLSAGQRQRIGLARALYRLPRLLLLDEPNANLDTDGETALVEVLKQMKSAGITVFIISHRSAALVSIDKLLYLMNGVAVGFGSRELVMAQIKRSMAAVDSAGSRDKGVTPGLTSPQRIGQ